MNKKYMVITSILLIVCVFGLIFINNRNEMKKDSYKFKKEYESLNGKKNDYGKITREVNIPKDNPIKYSSAKEIVKMMDNKESFVVYFGFSEYPWCRSIVENLITAAKNKNIDTVYYVDVQNIRDVVELVDGKMKTTDKGNKDYLTLIKKLDNVLSDYTLEDEDGNEVKVGEKRIYAPNIVSVVNGKAEELTEGTSSKESNPYMKLTKGMNKESIKKIEYVLKCLEKNVCTSKTSC